MSVVPFIPLSPAHPALALGPFAGLAANPWFAALPVAKPAGAARQRRSVAPAAGRDAVPPGGKHGAVFYGLLGGSMNISTLREDRREAIFVLPESGSWFGAISLLDGRPRTHEATALLALGTVALC